MNTYDTSSAAINDLNSRGYDHNFNLQNEAIYCHSKDLNLLPDEFQIDEVYRFEGDTNPDDEVIVYAISSTKAAIKGVLVNAYGVYAEPLSAELVEKLKIKR